MHEFDTSGPIESQNGYLFVVWAGRSANLGVPASIVERVVDKDAFRGDSALNLAAELEMDASATPVRVIELRTGSGRVALTTFGPLRLRPIELVDVLALPPLVRAQPTGALLEGLATRDGVADVWILDASSLARLAEVGSASAPVIAGLAPVPNAIGDP